MSASPASFDESDKEVVDSGPRDDPNKPQPPSQPARGTVLAAYAHKIAIREGSVFTNGTRHTARQLNRWWNAQDLSPEYLTAFHLNHQHTQWKNRRTADLREINTQLKHWKNSNEHQAHRQRALYSREANAVRSETFTPSPPSSADLAATRTARARNRRLGTTVLLAISVALAAQNPAPAAYTAGAVTLLAGAAVWIQGRRPTVLNPPPPRLGFPTPEPVPGVASALQPDPTPYPIVRATITDEAAECILRALQAENIPVAEITDVEQQRWGWQSTVRVSKGTPAAIINKAPDLETLFDLGKGDVIVQPLKSRTACATLLLRQGDMFADLPPAPYLAPKSISITDPAVYGGSANGSPLAFSLAGLMGEVIARSGGGKSTLLRALVDVTTACHDAVTLFLDPSGDGPGPYEDAIRLTSLDPATIERTLLWLHCLAAGRARIRRGLGMGDAWQPSSQHPAILVFIDEFPKLTELSKLLVASLLLIGRKEGVWIIFAAQGATTAFLGSNLAQQPALKILGSCRDVDVKAALGGGMMDEGWLPHRLNPKSGDDLRQCAQVYIEGAPGMPDDPMIHKVHHITLDEAKRRAAERAEAGLVEIDETSLAAALGAPLPDFVTATGDDRLSEPPTWGELLRLTGAFGAPAAAQPAIARHLLAAFTKHGNPPHLTVAQILDHLREADPEHWERWDDREEHTRLREAGKALARALRTSGLTLTSHRLPELAGKPTGYRLADLRGALE
ncbi:hypothetical protein [Streptomyces sp. NPDC001743]|uniref:hypothetical protein n=1 Tax=Streptomyces sp. NPDC001743 TaxID=3154397 RepID=UPI0033303AF6